MLRRVAVVLMEDVAVFEFGVLSGMFGIDRTDDGVPAFDFKVGSTRPGGLLRTSSHSAVIAPYGLKKLDDADLMPSSPGNPSQQNDRLTETTTAPRDAAAPHRLARQT